MMYTVILAYPEQDWPDTYMDSIEASSPKEASRLIREQLFEDIREGFDGEDGIDLDPSDYPTVAVMEGDHSDVKED